MILSNSCWMKNHLCNKYKKFDCECKENNIFCTKLFKVNALFNLALLTDKQKERVAITCDGVDDLNYNYLSEIGNNIVDFVSNGNNLYIWSPISGNCKTTWSIRLLQDYIYKIWTYSDIKCKALFINVPRFLLALKNSISNQSDYIDHIKENVLEADLIVWDDIATKGVTEFESENLLSMIDSRINCGKSNIFTSNVDPNGMYEMLGSRLASRVVNLSKQVYFSGADKRILSNSIGDK